MNLIEIKPPYKCIFCNSTNNTFTSQEHIVPHSLGNEILIMEKGWLCDECNNICSSFESRVINHSCLGAERAILGVITKKGKPSRSKYGKIHWNAEPNMGKNIISLDKKELEKIPILHNKITNEGKIIIPLHDKYNYDMVKLFLKIGVELLGKDLYQGACLKTILNEAIQHIIGRDNNIWPYFIIRAGNIKKHITSIFENTDYSYQYIESLGFDIFLDNINENIILFFFYGNFKVGISLTSRSTNWAKILNTWNVSYVGCPIEFKEYSNI